MKQIAYTFLIIASMVMYSCQQTATNTNQNPNNDATLKIKTKEDSALDGAIAVHDQVMPKMGKLIGYQKTLEKQLDSVSKSATAKALSETKLWKQRADTLLFELKMAQKDMNDWMEGFDPEPKLPTTEERTAYFQDQEQKAEKMKVRFFAALDKAKNMLGK